VVELLEAGADAAVTLTAIKEGTATGDAFKTFYAAEKQKLADGLARLKQQATAPQGSEPPAEPQGEQSADKKVASLAAAMSREKKIPIGQAIKAVLGGRRQAGGRICGLVCRIGPQAGFSAINDLKKNRSK